MAPRHAGVGAGLGDEAGEDAIAEQALGFVQFAGVDVGLAGVARGVDQKLGLVAAQQLRECGRVGVVEISPAQVAECQALALQQRLVG